MNDPELLNKTLEFEKYLRKLKIKQKDTVLVTSSGSFRTAFWRTDFVKEKLDSEHFLAISDIFKDKLQIKIENYEDFLNLLEMLTKRQLLLRLDRVPMTVKAELKKWPEKMQFANVF